MEQERQSKVQLDLDTSRAITGVRFLLIVFVVFIHNVITSVNLAKDLNLKDWIGLFAGRDMESAKGLFVPLVYQFWFLRELFFCVLLSPIIKKLVDKLPLFFAIFLILMLNSNWFYGAFRTAFFYFSLGCFAIRFNLTYKNLEKIKFIDIGFLYVFILTLRFYFYFSEKTGFTGIGTLSIITGGLLLLKISGVVSRNEKVFSVLKWLAGFSFWLYATHDPFLIGPIKKLWTRFLPINGYWLLVEYFGAVLLTIAISLGVGILVKKIMPKVFAILTGGR